MDQQQATQPCLLTPPTSAPKLDLKWATPLSLLPHRPSLPLSPPPPRASIPDSPQMSEIVEASQSSTQELQEQIDVYKEKNRRELSELQRQVRERGQELEKSRLDTKSLQEEVNKCPPRPQQWRDDPLF